MCSNTKLPVALGRTDELDRDLEYGFRKLFGNRAVIFSKEKH